MDTGPVLKRGTNMNLRNALYAEIITHESVHAAFAFSRRTRRRNLPWRDHITDHPEEEIAYPAGAIAQDITSKLYELDLFQK